MFNFDETKVPKVEFLKSWKLEDGTDNDIYQAGNWSFEADDKDLDYAEEAIYAWTAWYNFIKEQQSK
jgi:hypothetical protein